MNIISHTPRPNCVYLHFKLGFADMDKYAEQKIKNQMKKKMKILFSVNLNRESGEKK